MVFQIDDEDKLVELPNDMAIKGMLKNFGARYKVVDAAEKSWNQLQKRIFKIADMIRLKEIDS